MNVSGAGTATGSPTPRPIGAGGTAAARNGAGSSSANVEGDVLAYARMSPMERMRANILKGMNLTEEQLGALAQAEKQTIEDQIEDKIRKTVSDSGRTGRLVDISA